MFLQDMCRDLTFLKSLLNKVRYQIFIKFLNIYIDVNNRIIFVDVCIIKIIAISTKELFDIAKIKRCNKCLKFKALQFSPRYLTKN